MALASGPARLAGHGIHPQRLERERYAETDRDQRHLPAEFQSDFGIAATRPRESPLGTWPAVSAFGGNDSRSGAVHLRFDGREDRWTVRQTLSTGDGLERAF